MNNSTTPEKSDKLQPPNLEVVNPTESSSLSDKPYEIFHFYLHRCVIARTADEARRVASSWQNSNGEPFSIKPLFRPGTMYVESAPEVVACATEIGDYMEHILSDQDYGDPGREEMLFNHVRRMNDALSEIRAAKSQPASFPLVLSLELDEHLLLDFCSRVGAGDEVDADTKNYMFLRYPKLGEVIINFRLWYDETV